jgi:hypothetical protein
MPEPILYLLVLILAIVLLVCLLATYCDKQKSISFFEFTLLVEITLVSLVVWIVSANLYHYRLSDGTGFYPIVSEDIYPVKTIIAEDGTKQQFINTGDKLINVAKLFSRSLPDGSKVKRCCYDRKRCRLGILLLDLADATRTVASYQYIIPQEATTQSTTQPALSPIVNLEDSEEQRL